MISARIKSGSWERERSRLWADASESASEPSADSEADGGGSSRFRFAGVGALWEFEFDAVANEVALLVATLEFVCLGLGFGLGAEAEGPALLDARLGGLKGRWRFFCAGASTIFAVFVDLRDLVRKFEMTRFPVVRLEKLMGRLHVCLSEQTLAGRVVSKGQRGIR